MEEMERKIDEVHFMLSHLMKDKPLVTGLEVIEYLGVNGLGFMDIIIDESCHFSKAVSIGNTNNVFTCKWDFETVMSWKKRNSDTLAQYKNVSGDVHERIAESYRRVKESY